MMNVAPLFCDGCGQLASAEHVARRLQRLEWTTRYRPIHINTLLLGAAAPARDADFLYSGAAKFGAESRLLLEAVGVSSESKAAEAILDEFQRGGFLLTYLLDCPLENGERDPVAIAKLLEARLPLVLTRIRRSLKPKRLVPISRTLDPLIARLQSSELGCSLLLDRDKAFVLDQPAPSESLARLREALALAPFAR